MATLAKNGSTATTARIVLPGTKFHRLRKSVQLFCVAVFILLPLFNVVRFDLPRQRFYFFGAELWISEFAIIFFSLMFLMILIAAMAMLYGRVYCGYLCPQMIFSEAANALQSWTERQVDRTLTGLGPDLRRWLARALLLAALLPAAVLLTFVFISYFVQPAYLFERLVSLDIKTAAGVAGASITLLTLLDFAFLRQRFCTAICPYGYLQGMLSDHHTLLVRYNDPLAECIHCEKCIRVCPMGIDIRSSNHQIECTHCGECIDACSAVLGRLGKKPRIQYAWGDAGENVAAEHSWHRRSGLRDGKRVAVLLLLTVYASALAVAIHLRQPVLVRIMPNRIVLYTMGTDGLVHNRFRLMASNRGRTESTLTLSLEGMPAGHIVGMGNGVTLKPGESVQREFDLAAPATGIAPGVNRLRILTHVVPAQKNDALEETFIAPTD